MNMRSGRGGLESCGDVSEQGRAGRNMSRMLL